MRRPPVVIAEAIDQIEGGKHTELICKMKEIALLADQNIISTMIEQSNKPRYNIDLAKEFSDKEIEVPYDRVMWVNLHHNPLFRYTLKYIQVINIDGTRDFLIERKKHRIPVSEKYSFGVLTMRFLKLW